MNFVAPLEICSEDLTGSGLTLIILTQLKVQHLIGKSITKRLQKFTEYSTHLGQKSYSFLIIKIYFKIIMNYLIHRKNLLGMKLYLLSFLVLLYIKNKSQDLKQFKVNYQSYHLLLMKIS